MSSTGPDAGTDAVIHTDGLTKAYPGGTLAVDALDLLVRRGEIFGLLGPNGAGKTTTIGMLTTRVVPTAGTALVAGLDVVETPTEVRRRIGVVPQTNTLDRSLTVWENLYFHGRYFGMKVRDAKSAADEAVERFRLANRSSSQVEHLSGGMAQRLMLARAVLHRPEILFLDEPTGGLDPQSRLALWDLMDELHAQGETILLTTHSMEEADRLCERVAIVDHGRIVALDTPAALKASIEIGSTITVRGRGDLARLSRELAGAAKTADVMPDEGLVRLQLETLEGALESVIAAANRSSVTLTEVSMTEPTLETVFIRLTGRDLRE